MSELNILVICQHYWPEPYRLAEICEKLVERGNNVTVLTDIPNYPVGYIYPGYEKGKNRKEEINGVRINRVFTIPRHKNVLFRFLNYFSYMLSSSAWCRITKDEYDVVFTQQTSPVMMSNAAHIYAKKHRVKSVMYCMDLWPASLHAGGVKNESIIYKFFEPISRYIYQRMDHILVSSTGFEDYLNTVHSIELDKIEYLPQYADEKKLEPYVADKNKVYKFVFAGNIGTAQNLKVVIDALHRMRRTDIEFHIYGNGSELDNYRKYANSLKVTNAIFEGRVNTDEIHRVYTEADALFVSLMKDDSISLTLPAKIQDYMSAGRPIIASADGAIPKVIDEAKCGLCSPADDVGSLIDDINRFINLSAEEKERMANNAIDYFDKYYTKNIFIDHLETTLERFSNTDD